jgi:hypothetical protein
MTQQGTLVAAESGAAAAPPADRSATSELWSARVFAAAVVVALPLILWFGRDHWFFLDDWSALTRDGLTKPGYLDDHNGHWSTLLRLEYRLNFELWGLSSYLPYQVPAVLGHLASAILLREVCRRLGARGWIATACALAFLFFGTGRENMVFAFQFSQTGSVVCGLAMFLLARGPRSVTRRDWLVLVVGVLGLMTSGTFLAFLAGFGVSTLQSRGVRVTAFYALPLGAIYSIWYLRYGREGASPLEPATEAARFGARMFWATFDGLAEGGLGAVLVAVAAFSLCAAVHRAWRSREWADAALPLGLATGWLAFATLTALARANVLPGIYSSSRYLHVGAALLLPLVAAGAEHLARRRMLLGAVALIPLAIGLPGNLDRLSHTEWVRRGNRQLVYAMAHSPFVDEVSPDTRAFPGIQLTAGWLARQAAAGRIPKPATDPMLELNATSALVLAQDDGLIGQGACPRLTGPMALSLEAGDQVRFAGAIGVSATDGRYESLPRQFTSSGGTAIRSRAGPVDVVVRPAIGEQARVCAPDADEAQG